jgi:hypothetical protein
MTHEMIIKIVKKMTLLFKCMVPPEEIIDNYLGLIVISKKATMIRTNEHHTKLIKFEIRNSINPALIKSITYIHVHKRCRDVACYVSQCTDKGINDHYP